MASKEYYENLFMRDENLAFIEEASIQDILKGDVKSYGLDGQDKIASYGLCWERGNRIKALNWRLDSNNLGAEDLNYLKQNLHKINWNGFEKEIKELERRIEIYEQENRKHQELEKIITLKQPRNVVDILRKNSPFILIPKSSPLYRLYTNNLQNISELVFIEKNLDNINWDFYRVTKEDVAGKIDSAWKELETRLKKVAWDLEYRKDQMSDIYLTKLKSWMNNQEYEETHLKNWINFINMQVTNIELERENKRLINKIKRVFKSVKKKFKPRAKYSDNLVTVSAIAK